MIIRTSKHKINNITNVSKLNTLDGLFADYTICLEYYINLIISNVLPLKNKISSRLLPTYNILHSKYKRDIYIKASEIIRSQTKKASEKRYKKYKYLYKYYIENKPDSKFTKLKFSELKLKNILNSKYFTKPNLNNISINLTDELFNLKSGVYFDKFVNIKLPYFNEKGTRALQINLPLKQHRHSNRLKSNGFNLKKNIQIKKINNEYFINLIWYKEDINKIEYGESIGIDVGYKKLITTSRGEVLGKEMFDLYQRISKKQQGSKNFKQLLIHRDNMINYHCNTLNLNNLNKIVVENLINVKHKSKLNKTINNKIQRWSYLKTIEKLSRICDERGVELVKVSPAYTSQTCSSCGSINKDSRKGEEFVCIDCGFEIDADINASINIHNRGIYSFSNQ